MFPDKNPIERLKKVPPFLLHALASCTNGGGPRQRPPLAEIVKRSGLTERTYLRTARKESWDNVKLEVIEGMIRGTGVNPFNFKNESRFLRQHGFKIPYLNARQQAVLDTIAASALKFESRD